MGKRYSYLLGVKSFKVIFFIKIVKFEACNFKFILKLKNFEYFY